MGAGRLWRLRVGLEGPLKTVEEGDFQEWLFGILGEVPFEGQGNGAVELRREMGADSLEDLGVRSDKGFSQRGAGFGDIREKGNGRLISVIGDVVLEAISGCFDDGTDGLWSFEWFFCQLAGDVVVNIEKGIGLHSGGFFVAE